MCQRFDRDTILPLVARLPVHSEQNRDQYKGTAQQAAGASGDSIQMDTVADLVAGERMESVKNAEAQKYSAIAVDWGQT